MAKDIDDLLRDVFGNSTNRRIEFEKPLDELINSEIKLKIELKDCNIYSYTFEN